MTKTVYGPPIRGPYEKPKCLDCGHPLSEHWIGGRTGDAGSGACELCGCIEQRILARRRNAARELTVLVRAYGPLGLADLYGLMPWPYCSESVVRDAMWEALADKTIDLTSDLLLVGAWPEDSDG